MTNETDKARATKIFISYSRRNKTFVRKLHEALAASGIDTWVDWEGIPLSSDWMAEITAAIESGDAFVFVISPDSLKSKVCMDELELGLKYNKKIIPVLYIDPEKGQKMHPKLASTNWVYLRQKKDDFNATIPKLVAAIQTDLGWIQKHTRLLQRSIEWEQQKRNNSYVLQGADLEDGEKWVTQANPEVGRVVVPQQAEYLHESRKVSVRRQRNLTIGVGIALILSVMMGIFAFQQRSIALENEQKAKDSEAVAVSNEMARAAQQAIAEENAKVAEENAKIARANENIAKAQRSASEGRIYQEKAGELGTSTLLAIDAYKQLPDLVEAEDILRQNLSLLVLPVKQMNTGARISKIQVISDRTKFVTSDQGGKACVWSTQDGTLFFCTEQEGALYDSVFSRDGKTLATASSKGEVILWDAATGEKKKSFQYEGIVWDLQSHPNGYWLGVGRTNGVSIIDMNKMEEYGGYYSLSTEVNKLDFDPSGKYMAFGMADGNVFIWEILSKRTILGPKHNNEVVDVSFSPDGKWIVSAGMDSALRAFKLGEGIREQYSVVHGDWVEYTAFGPDASWFITASDDGFVRMIDTVTGQERMRMAHDNFVQVARISSDGQWIASTGHDHTARIWDSSSGNEMAQIPVEGIGSAITFNPDATRLIVGDRLGNITLWDTSRLQARQGVVSFSEYLREAHFSPNGEWLTANTDDKKLWLIKSDQLGKPNDGREALVTFKGLSYGVAVSADSKWIAAVEYDANIAEYNRVILKSVEGEIKIPLSHDTKVINTVVFTPDSKQVVTADDNGLIYFWDVATGKRTGSLQAEGVILSLSISPDGKYLVAGIEEGGHNLVWDLTTLTQVETLDEVGATYAVKFSPDGKWLATGGSESAIQLWSVADGSFTRTEHLFHISSDLLSLSFSADSSLLAAGDASGYVYLVDVNRKEEVARLQHVDQVTGLSFSVDGKRLAVASQRGLSLWDIPSIQFIYRDQLIAEACSRLIENFGPTKWKIIFGDAEYRLICPDLPAGKN